MFKLNENRKSDKVLDAARIDEAKIMGHLDTIVKSTIVSGCHFNNQNGKVGIRLETDESQPNGGMACTKSATHCAPSDGFGDGPGIFRNSAN